VQFAAASAAAPGQSSGYLKCIGPVARGTAHLLSKVSGGGTY
jgi:hypothetical protein